MPKKLVYFLKLICFLPLIYGLPITVDVSNFTIDQTQLELTYDLEPYYNVTDWSQRNSDGQITVPWSAYKFPEEKLEELLKALTSMEREVDCMRFPYITQHSLNSTMWANGVVFSWNDQGPCNSDLGVGIGDIEVVALSVLFETLNL